MWKVVFKKINLTSANTIANNIETAKYEVVNGFLYSIKKRLEENLGNDWVVIVQDIRKRWSSLSIKHKKWTPDVHIGMQGQSSMINNKTILGFPYGVKGKEMIGEIIYGSLKNEYKNSSTAWTFHKQIFNLGNYNQFSKLLGKESAEDFVKDVSNTIEKLARQLEEPLKE